jgi:hypothetical protein
MKYLKSFEANMLDTILDKISEYGIDSLSNIEKEYLEKSRNTDKHKQELKDLENIMLNIDEELEKEWNNDDDDLYIDDPTEDEQEIIDFYKQIYSGKKYPKKTNLSDKPVIDVYKGKIGTLDAKLTLYDIEKQSNYDGYMSIYDEKHGDYSKRIPVFYDASCTLYLGKEYYNFGYILFSDDEYLESDFDMDEQSIFSIHRDLSNEIDKFCEDATKEMLMKKIKKD